MKRLFALMLSGLILTSSIPMNSYASIGETATDVAPISITKEEPASGSTVEPTPVGLEKAIKAVKEKITISKEYTEFNYYFYNTNSYSDSYWSLNWSNPITDSFIQVNCDADNHITFYSKYDYSNKSTGISKYLKKELKATAEAFITQIAPETENNLKYIDATFEGIYSGNYVYNYQRINNGVDFPDNKASVSVNSVTGEVSSATISWIHGVPFPTSKAKLSKEDAAKFIKENMKMKLVYRTDYYGIYDKNGSSSNKKAYLVYEPTLTYISIDANTGEVYLDRSEWVDTAATNQSKEESAASDSLADGSRAVALTEEEIAKIEELKGVISKAKAIETVTRNPYLLIDKNLKSYTATLNKWDDGSGDTSYVWNINLSDPREVDYTKETTEYRAYAYATVDAKTGKILSFNSSVKSNFDELTQEWKTVKIKYDKEAGKAILEKFLKSQINNRFSNSILVGETDDYIAYYKEKDPIYGGYSYQYNRVNEGVEYPYNGIYGSIDGVTGKVYSFSSNWDNNVTFEPTKGAMSPEKAMEEYLNKDGFDLKYEVNVINKYDSSIKNEEVLIDYSNAYTVEYEIRLVYRPDINPSLISPFTGEQLDYQGEVYKKNAAYSYLDVKDTKENRDILLLADMNIGFEGENFLPSKDITIKEMNELLQKVGYGYEYNADEDSKADQPITREEIAQAFIIKLGLEKVSKLSGIYRTGYNDENSIDAEYYGAVALAKGLELLEADENNNFNAKNNVSRFNAVKLILKFIGAGQVGNVYQ